MLNIRSILVKFPDIKLHEHPSKNSRILESVQKDRVAEGQTEFTRRPAWTQKRLNS
jgi:hypothetical protein